LKEFELWIKVDELGIGNWKLEIGFLFIVPFRNIRGESRGDGGVVHDVVKRRRFNRFFPQLFRLLLCEAPSSELWPGPAQFPLRIRFRFPFRLWADVVRLRGPAEQRGPPIWRNGLSAAGIGLSGRARRGPDDGGLEKRECGCHLWERREEQWIWFCFGKERKVVQVEFWWKRNYLVRQDSMRACTASASTLMVMYDWGKEREFGVSVKFGWWRA